MKVAIYARYSSDNQRDASIADQLRICREFAARQGWTVVQEFTDHAISGATLLRSGFQALMRDALNRRFDVVLAESLDRFSRDQEDTAGLFKRLTFAGVNIVTLAEGDITHLHIGFKGTMNALFLKDLAEKTHRGLRGRVADAPVPLLHPNLAALYREKVATLASARQNADSRSEAAEALRGLLDAIVLVPTGNQLRIELKGNLAAMLSAAQNAKRSPEGDLSLQIALVAGARNSLKLEFSWSGGVASSANRRAYQPTGSGRSGPSSASQAIVRVRLARKMTYCEPDVLVIVSGGYFILRRTSCQRGSEWRRSNAGSVFT